MRYNRTSTSVFGLLVAVTIAFAPVTTAGLPDKRTTTVAWLRWQADTPVQVVGVLQTRDHLAWAVALWNTRDVAVTQVQLAACYSGVIGADQLHPLGSDTAPLQSLDVEPHGIRAMSAPTLLRRDLSTAMSALGCSKGVAAIGVVRAEWADGYVAEPRLPFEQEMNQNRIVPWTGVEQQRLRDELDAVVPPDLWPIPPAYCEPRRP